MTVLLDTNLSTQTLVLQIYEPREQIDLRFASELLSEIEEVYWQSSLVRGIVEFQFGELPQIIVGDPEESLVIRRIESGSLLLELAQEVFTPEGAVTLLIAAHVLRHGPGKLYEWARLPNDVRAEWYKSRVEMKKAKAASVEATATEIQIKRRTTKWRGMTILRLMTRSKSYRGAVDQVGDDRHSVPLPYAEDVNKHLQLLNESVTAIRRKSSQLEVHVLDESGNSVEDPFRKK